MSTYVCQKCRQEVKHTTCDDFRAHECFATFVAVDGSTHKDVRCSRANDKKEPR